ncbi:MAG: outer membrane protein [Gammaproteobacteria bacterium]|jgi:outer membrane protein
MGSIRYKNCPAWIRILLPSCLLLTSLPSFAAELTIRLDNPPESGIVEFQIYDSANSFGAQSNPIKTARYNLNDLGPYIIKDLSSGEYALLVYYDENDNKRIDKNFIGIPVEPIGFSNRYTPRAPPNFSRAAFVINEDETRHFDVNLYLPLGKRGQLGVGLGVITRTSPYREYNGSVSQFIPAITYIGDRLQVFGPRFQWGLAGSGKLRLALAGEYRIGVYQEEDSPLLVGMGDRDNTLLAGLVIQAELPGAVDLELGYKYDVLDRIGGGVASLGLSKGLQFGIFRLTPQLGLNYLSTEISNYDFGVPANRATAARPAYQLDSTISIEAGIGLFAEIAREWVLLVNVSVEKLSDEVTDSSIIDQDSVVKGFAAINYLF